jgi:hypothetical protein
MTAENEKGPVKTKFRQPIFCQSISMTTNGSGAGSGTSDVITGEILKISYVKDTVNAATTAVLTFTTPATTVSLDSYDVNGGSAERYVYAKIQGSTDAYTRHIIADSAITVSVTGGALSKAFTVYVYYR